MRGTRVHHASVLRLLRPMIICGCATAPTDQNENHIHMAGLLCLYQRYTVSTISAITAVNIRAQSAADISGLLGISAHRSQRPAGPPPRSQQRPRTWFRPRGVAQVNLHLGLLYLHSYDGEMMCRSNKIWPVET